MLPTSQPIDGRFPTAILLGKSTLKDSMWVRLSNVFQRHCKPGAHVKRNQYNLAMLSSKHLLSFCTRLRIWHELEDLKDHMDHHNTLGEAEFQRVALTVAYALLNNSK